jgi:hypothetical protein
MDVPLCRDLFEPTAESTLDQYRKLLSEKEDLWIQAYTRPPPPQQTTITNQIDPCHQIKDAGLHIVNLNGHVADINLPPPMCDNYSLVCQCVPIPVWHTPLINCTLQHSNAGPPPSPRAPCPHLATGQTYYHLWSQCHLPDPQRFPPRRIAAPTLPHVEQINFGAQTSEPHYPPQNHYSPEEYCYDNDDVGCNAISIENFHQEVDGGTKHDSDPPSMRSDVLSVRVGWTMNWD